MTCIKIWLFSCLKKIKITKGFHELLIILAHFFHTLYFINVLFTHKKNGAYNSHKNEINYYNLWFKLFWFKLNSSVQIWYLPQSKNFFNISFFFVEMSLLSFVQTVSIELLKLLLLLIYHQIFKFIVKKFEKISEKYYYTKSFSTKWIQKYIIQDSKRW